MAFGQNITNRQWYLEQLHSTWFESATAAWRRLQTKLRSIAASFENKPRNSTCFGTALSVLSTKRYRCQLRIEKQTPKASRSSEKLTRLRTAGEGNVRRDKFGRLREIRGTMMIFYDEEAVPTLQSPVDTVLYVGLEKRSIVRQPDGTYNLYEHPTGNLFMNSVALALDQRTGIVSGVMPSSETTILIPPNAPILLQIGGANDSFYWTR